MSPYKVAVNMEWSSKCNARCVMCPQHLIHKPQLMKSEIFHRALGRINTDDVFRTVIAGYGEPTTHPHFMDFISAVGDHPVRFDLVSNGQELNQRRLRHLDGKIDLLMISFSSIESSVYNRVHVKLNHDRVKQNISLAQKTLKHTRLGISLTPLSECLDTLQETIGWLKRQGISLLTMSPTLYNRSGNMTEHEESTQRLRRMISRHQLHSQELDFIPSIKDSIIQSWRNKFRCVPRNSDIFITASGDYLYCSNDISHTNTIGHVDKQSVREVITQRETMPCEDDICENCNLRDRYRAKEMFQVAGKHLSNRLLSYVNG